nr:nucleosome assembly protein 1;2-like [Ipomoea batatas]
MNSEDRVYVSAAIILKLLRFARGPDESFQSLNPSTELQRRVIALREIQNKHDEFELEYNKEKAAHVPSTRRYTTHCMNRFKIVIGVVEGEDNDGTQNLGVGRDEDKGLPSFWLRQVRREDPAAADLDCHLLPLAVDVVAAFACQVRREDPAAADLDCHLLPLAVDVVAALPGEPESLTKCH